MFFSQMYWATDYSFKGQFWKTLMHRGLWSYQSTLPPEFQDLFKADFTVSILAEGSSCSELLVSCSLPQGFKEEELGLLNS